MLGDSIVNAIVPTTDIARARSFYVDTLGLMSVPIPNEDAGDTLLLRSGNSYLLVYERPTPSSADHTLAAWMVTDIETVADDLIARGVAIETFPGMPDVTWDSRGIASLPNGIRTVWFRDPDGNFLAVNQADGLPL